MNILVLNASPKGKNSTTVHTALYLQALHPEHTFTAGRSAAVLLPGLYLYCTLSAPPAHRAHQGRRRGSLWEIRLPDHDIQALL